MKKQSISTIAEKRRIVNNIIEGFLRADTLLLLGHKNPDEDCISSMVAFGLILSKFSKKTYIYLQERVHPHFQYLLNICTYNAITIIDSNSSFPEDIQALVILDTPKGPMLEPFKELPSLLSEKNIIKIEIDHHLEADSSYIGDPPYCLVDEASSTCELIGFLAFKLRCRAELLERHQITELFSRNFVLAVLTGIIGDSKMGKYLKTTREKRFYRIFSKLFEELLTKKTLKSSKNFATMQEVFDEIKSLSESEKNCFAYFMGKRTSPSKFINSIVLKPEDMLFLKTKYTQETIIEVARYAADILAEKDGFLSLIIYFDDPTVSDLIQFRIRRSQYFKNIDVRKILEILNIENGGGHPGAIGFRISRNSISDFESFFSSVISSIESLVDEFSQEKLP